MNDQKRKNHAPEEKVSILRRHLIEKVPVSNLCEEQGLHPTVFYRWLKMAPSKFYSWQERYGRVDDHNAWIPRDFWPEPSERQAILDFQGQFRLEGYRRLKFMMLDANVVAVSPASVWRSSITPAVSRAGTRAPRRRAAASTPLGLLMSIGTSMFPT